MKQIKLVVLGEPMGKGRPRFSTFNGYVKTHTPKETTNYESKVVFEYTKQYDHMIFERNDELQVFIYAYFSISKSHYRYHKKTNSVDLDQKGVDMANGKVCPTKKPDCDNIAKICLDALNGIGFPDDSQVVSLWVSKKYTKEQPKVEILIMENNYENKD